MSAFYVNELVIRFLHKGDPHPGLYASYEETLRRLGRGDAPDVVLRRFEIELLAESGYGLTLGHDAVTGEALDPDARYEYVVEKGPVRVDEVREARSSYSGAALLAMGGGDLGDPAHLASARRLLRDVLDHHLAGKPLRTREVFAAMRN
jgi:DNA repair protein RecO (recombination protein O)